MQTHKRFEGFYVKKNFSRKFLKPKAIARRIKDAGSSFQIDRSN